MLEGRAIAFTTGLSLVAALLSGLAPALQASKADVVSALKDDSQCPSDKRSDLLRWVRHEETVEAVYENGVFRSFEIVEREFESVNISP